MVTEVCKIGRAFARGQTLSKKTNVETTRWQSATGGAPALAGAPIPRVTREATAAEPEVRSTKMMRLLVGFWDSGVPWYPAFCKGRTLTTHIRPHRHLWRFETFLKLLPSQVLRGTALEVVNRDRLLLKHRNMRMPSVPGPAQETKELSFCGLHQPQHRLEDHPT